MVYRKARMPRIPGLLLSLAAVMLLFGLAACGSSVGGGGLYGTSSNSGTTSGATATPAAAQTQCDSSSAAICTRSVQVSGASMTALVTPAGKTLYYFMSDSATMSACTGSCTADWSPLLSSSASVAPIASLSGTLTTFQRSEGMQVVYNGHPLYTFAGDSAPGDATGNGIESKWYVATPTLKSSDGSGGSGYNNGY